MSDDEAGAGVLGADYAIQEIPVTIAPGIPPIRILRRKICPAVSRAGLACILVPGHDGDCFLDSVTRQPPPEFARRPVPAEFVQIDRHGAVIGGEPA